MQGLFLEYNDPLFGLIVFFSIIFIITLITYIWNLYSSNHANRHIINFVNQFNRTDKPQNLQILLENKEVPSDALELLADNYFKAAQYEEAILISIDLLKRKNSIKQRKPYLFLLAQSYFKAGFYKRSESTFVELLRCSINEPKALRYLIVLYERLHRFDEALDILESLDEMGEAIAKEAAYINAMRILFDSKITPQDKPKKLLAHYKDHPELIRPVYINLFRMDKAFAWENLPLDALPLIVDILWNQSKEDLNFDIISKTPFLRALYFAHGSFDTIDHSGFFEIDILASLQANNKDFATLQIEYLCLECKEITPLMNNRCPHCMALLTLEPQLSVTQKVDHESYYSF
ncbi:MAG: hypothetical protein OEW60_06475 [Thiovulaceae bacterium]|nr:hypothetical protein [Sulfurimonadaceae bacterium]